MWRRKKSRIFLDIFLLLLIAGVSAFMYMGYKQIQTKQAQQDQELIALANQSQQQTKNAKEQSYEELEAEFKKDTDTVAQFLPGIVCWGDALTQGTASGVSYPGTLEKLITERLVSQYNFKMTIPNYYDYSRVDWDQYKISIPVVNMGTGHESVQTILGRSGAENYVVSKEFTIPSDCSSVSIKFTAQDGTTVKPLINGDGGLNPVTINGVEGTLTPDPDSYSEYSDGVYTFRRSKPGEETLVERYTEIIPADYALYRDYIHIIYVGTYGKYHSAEELVEITKKMISRQTKNRDRFIVIGISSGTFTSSSFYDQFASLMVQEYGDRFLNFRKYLMTEAIQDLGITPTYKDTQNLKYGHMPASLYVTGSDTEFISAVYEKLGRMVYDRMESLGYFNEVREELKIPAWTGDSSVK